MRVYRSKDASTISRVCEQWQDETTPDYPGARSSRISDTRNVDSRGWPTTWNPDQMGSSDRSAYPFLGSLLVASSPLSGCIEHLVQQAKTFLLLHLHPCFPLKYIYISRYSHFPRRICKDRRHISSQVFTICFLFTKACSTYSTMSTDGNMKRSTQDENGVLF